MYLDTRLFEIFVFILYHFASRFKYTRGTREYLMTHRLKYNCEYRARIDIEIIDVIVGYRSKGNFVRVFFEMIEI